jgi:MFS family permease
VRWPAHRAGICRVTYTGISVRGSGSRGWLHHGAVPALVGKLGDLYGRKRVFQAAVVFFVIGSVSCALAQSMAMLVGSRALQGIGGGGITVTARAR